MMKMEDKLKENDEMEDKLKENINYENDINFVQIIDNQNKYF